MPSPDAILRGLQTLAGHWRVLAIVWHAWFAVAIVGLAAGWRPQKHILVGVLVPPMLSVAALAWSAGNPFNGVFFLGLGAAVAAVGLRLPRERVRTAPAWALPLAAALFAYAWVYPHFAVPPVVVAYLAAAPVGVIPCPTLAMVIAVAVMLDALGSRLLAGLLGAAGLFYGFFGALRLGVTLDWGLAAGAVLLFLTAWFPRRAHEPAPQR